MPDHRWMLYGAYGYTGTLIAEEAVRRGHRPLLAGRDRHRLAALADRLDLDYVAFDLSDEAAIARQLTSVDLVFHAAGPYMITARPMVHACLLSQTHYLDITGEIPVFEHTFKHAEAAAELGITLASGMGFDVIPTDCLAAYVAGQLPDADTLAIGIRAIGETSGGTAKSMLEIIAGGGLLRRSGELVRYPLGQGARVVAFPSGDRTAVPIPWGDLSTAYRTTGIPNITTYFVMPRSQIALMQLAPLAVPLMTITPLRRLLQAIIGALRDGPAAEVRDTARSEVWVQATNPAGDSVEAWLTTREGYHFTAVAGVRAVERVLAAPQAGAFSPAQVLGSDFVLEVPGTTRHDSLPG